MSTTIKVPARSDLANLLFKLSDELAYNEEYYLGDEYTWGNVYSSIKYYHLPLHPVMIKGEIYVVGKKQKAKKDQ